MFPRPQESVREYDTAGVTSHSSLKDTQSLERLARELAVLATSGHSSYRKLAAARLFLLSRFGPAFEMSMLKDNSGTSSSSGGGSTSATGAGTGTSGASSQQAIGVAPLFAMTFRGLLTMLQDRACQDVQLCERVLSQVIAVVFPVLKV